MKKLFTILLLSFAITGSNYAQNYLSSQDRFFLGYEVAVPSGFITKTSWTGGRFDYRRMLTPNISIGIGASWNSFSEYVPQNTYQKKTGDGAVTSDIVKDVYTVPITASAHYYFSAGKKAIPYVGLGLGGQYSDQTVYLNVFTLEEYNWGFVARPEVGVIVPFADNAGMFLSVAYNYATNKNDAFDISHMQHFAFTLGFTFGTR